jgi:type I restriction-modification system DNA methylase subunit
MKEAFKLLEEANPDLEGIFTINFKAPLPEKTIRRCIQQLDQRMFDTRICSSPSSAYSPLALAIEEIIWRYFNNAPDHYTDMEIAILQTRVMELGILYEKTYDPASVTYEEIYDPAAGLGMSLLACAKSLRNNAIRIEGQELDEGIRACAMLNLILHGFYNSHIRGGDVITEPQWTNKDGVKKIYNSRVGFVIRFRQMGS